MSRRHPFDRFDDLYIPEPNSGCWIWLGSLNNKGYGRFQLKRNGYSCIFAHRFSYQVHNCIEVPNHMDVCHSCDLPCCVNPDHLWVGTRKQNMLDCCKKGRFVSIGLSGSLNGRSVLTEAQATEILNDRRSLRKIAIEYGCGITAIGRIKSGKSW